MDIKIGNLKKTTYIIFRKKYIRLFGNPEIEKLKRVCDKGGNN